MTVPALYRKPNVRVNNRYIIIINSSVNNCNSSNNKLFDKYFLLNKGILLIRL